MKNLDLSIEEKVIASLIVVLGIALIISQIVIATKAQAKMVADDGVAQESVATIADIAIQPCCTIEPNDPPEPEIVPTKHTRTGSYVWKAPITAKQGTAEEWKALQRKVGAKETGVFDYGTFLALVKFNQ